MPKVEVFVLNGEYFSYTPCGTENRDARSIVQVDSPSEAALAKVNLMVESDLWKKFMDLSLSERVGPAEAEKQVNEMFADKAEFEHLAHQYLQAVGKDGNYKEGVKSVFNLCKSAL